MSLNFDLLGLEPRVWNSFFGAGLGAAFYTLIKTQPYLANRSFDPKYNAAYLNRFVTGIISGVILATALYEVFKTSGALKSGSFALSPGILAILGGYASEAVEEILQRLVDVLLALVRGDGAEQVKGEAAAQQAATNVEVRGKLIDLEKAKGDPAQFDAVLKDIHASLKKASS
jgi:hypothetical protein